MDLPSDAWRARIPTKDLPHTFSYKEGPKEVMYLHIWP